MSEGKTPLWLRRDALLRELFTVLAAHPDGLHYKKAISAVRDRIPPVGSEASPVPGNPGQDKYENQLLWFTVDTVKASWLLKSNGHWRLTDEGRAALEQYPGAGELADAASEKYRTWLGQKKSEQATDTAESGQWDLLRRALDALPPGTWTSFSDLALLIGTSPPTVGWWLNEHSVENTYRVLRANGEPYDQQSRPRLTEAGIAFQDNGRADPSQRADTDVLRELVGIDGDTPERQRAWLVRGSSVNGYNLVPVWLSRGSCSLAASRLREIEPPIGRDQLREIVDADYAHGSYNARNEKLTEFDTFLNRMHEDDLVLTTSGGAIYLGTLAGPAAYVKSSDDRSNLRRPVTWLNADAAVDFADLAGSLQAKLSSQHTIVDLTSELPQLDQLVAPYRETPEPAQPPVTEARLPDATPELAEQLLVDQDWLQECIDLLRDRRQLIFYGPPGTGKTFLAQAIAEHVAGHDGVKLVQFHPAYSYEDFFEGYRPVPSTDGSNSVGFKLSPGPFRRLVDLARENPGSPYVLVIDEINRANLAKVFGELYFLLEYRDRAIDLLYSAGDEAAFTLPKNVYLIGTMNTADRSIALVDAAMRRRFAFLELHPSIPPAADLLPRWLDKNGLPDANARLLNRLNERIEDDDFKIGPSYFMRSSVYEPGGLARMWRTSILPLLEEHHYGESVDVAKHYDLTKLLASLGPADVGSSEDGIADGTQ